MTKIDPSSQSNGLSQEEMLDLIKTVEKLAKITADVTARNTPDLKESKQDADQ